MPNGNAEHLSLSQALERVIQRGQQAFFAQFQLLRVEAEEDVTRTLEGAAMLFAGLAVIACAWIAFMVLAVHLLRQPLSLAASLAFVGGLNLGLGGWLIMTSIRTMRRIRLLKPDAEPVEPVEAAAAASEGALSVPAQRELVKPAVEKTEEELKEGIEDLLATINNRFDFGKRIVEHPVPWLAGSLFVGFMLGHPRAR
jgi:Putative Actinobacterial Holin-X, holin superfamily III